MSSNKRNDSLRIPVLITSPKKADKAAEICRQRNIPTAYRINAVGTAPNDMIDILGLGSPDKAILVTALPKANAAELLKLFKKQLKLGAVDSGIAFTLPLTGASALLLHIMDKQLMDAQNITSIRNQNTERKEDNHMATTHSLILATVNQGFSQEVMDAARTAGAGGGTVVHSHRVGDEKEASLWGLSFQEEKDMVIIVADNQNKLNIMNAISEKCGMNSEAKGMVVSMPIDTVIGLD